jgi:3',5'-cyclic AMP phosphodiesterase CpdA
MVRIAQLSDFHLLEPDHARRRGLRSWRLKFLSAHRALDAARRVRHAREALAAARAADADHVVLTGDLTEDGIPAQFEVLAELLHESGITPSRITLVPGNHDAVEGADAWGDALRGPLRAFAATSAAGEEVVVGGVSIVPVDTSVHQHWVFSSGRMAPSHQRAVESAVARGRAANRAVALVQHHPVMPYANLAMQWVDGMHGHRRARTLLHDEAHVQVIHGHIHRASQRSLVHERSPQVFSAPAVVDGDATVRVYALRDGALQAA